MQWFSCRLANFEPPACKQRTLWLIRKILEEPLEVPLKNEGFK